MNADFGSSTSDKVRRELERSLGAEATHGELREAFGADTQLSLVSDWAQRGAETYSLIFDALTPSGVQRCVLKVCVAGYGDHTGTLSRWMARRSAIAAHGIQVPRLFARSGAAFCEEHIPLSLGDALTRANRGSGDLLLSLAFALVGLSRLGFNPGRLDDLRSRGADVVVVDLGSDLTLPWDGDLGRMLRQYTGSELRAGRKEALLRAMATLAN